MKKCAAEFIGTFALVFAGTGAIVVDEVMEYEDRTVSQYPVL